MIKRMLGTRPKVFYPEKQCPACTGVNIIQPEPLLWRGRPREVRVFIEATMRWLSLNLLLGQDRASVLSNQVHRAHAFAALPGLYIAHFEPIAGRPRVTLESTIIESNGHFLHSLNLSYASTQLRKCRRDRHCFRHS